jgi:hypothetical protein
MAATPAEIAVDVKRVLREQLSHLAVARAQSHVPFPALRDLYVFEEVEDGEVVGVYVAINLMRCTTFDGARMFAARVNEILTDAGYETIAEDLSVQVMGEAFGL